MIIDLIIIGFACISVAAFVGTKDDTNIKQNQNITIEKTE